MGMGMGNMDWSMGWACMHSSVPAKAPLGLHGTFQRLYPLLKRRRGAPQWCLLLGPVPPLPAAVLGCERPGKGEMGG